MNAQLEYINHLLQFFTSVFLLYWQYAFSDLYAGIIGWSLSMVCMDARVTPSNDIDYSCHINHRTYSTNHMGSISHTTSY